MTRRRALAVFPVVGLLCAGLAAGSSAASAADAVGSGAALAGAGAAGTVGLFAGGGTSLADGVPATDAALDNPRGLTHDAAGNVFVTDGPTSHVRRVDARTGLISTVSGVRGPGQAPQFGPADPQALAVSAAGDLFVVGFSQVEEFTHDGRLLTITGPGGLPQLAGVTVKSLAVDPAGNLYLSDTSDLFAPRILKLSASGVVSTFAGGGGEGYGGDGGPAVGAPLDTGFSLLWSADGALVFATGNRVRRVGSDGIISTVAGGGSSTCDGAPASASNLRFGLGVAADASGRLLISESDRSQVQRLDSDGTLHTVMGQGYSWTGPRSATLGGPAALSSILGPWSPTVLPDGRLLVAERGWDGKASPNRVLAVLPGQTPGIAHGYAGTGTLAQAGRAGDGRAACDADLAYPTSVARAADRSTYVADYQNSQIRRIGPDGRISTVAGTGLPGFSGDGGPATAAQLNHPRAVAVDPAGRVLIADVVNNRIRRLDPATGLITTIAGTGQWGSTGNGGPATSARLAGPHGVAVSADGTVWVADTGNHTIRRISPDGTISTAAGTGTPGNAGDGGPASAAQLSSPRSVAVDGTALYLSDPGTRSVRRVDLATGTISTLTGPSTGTPLTNPASLLPTPAGLLVADAGGDRILRLTPSGAVTVVAGTGSTDPAMPRDVARAAGQVNLAQPQGLTAEADGTLVVADTAHHRLLRITQP